MGVLKYSTSNTFSAIRTIALEEGIRGLYKGLGPALLTVPLFWSMYWCTYNRVKEVLVDEFPTTPVAFIHVTAAISAGAIGDVITNPLWVTRTRIQTLILHSDSALAPNISTLCMMQSIYRKEGIGAFYKGLGASFLGLSHVAVQFPLYEYLKKIARERRKGEEESVRTHSLSALTLINPIDHAFIMITLPFLIPLTSLLSINIQMLDLIGASITAKLVASVLTYPHEVLRSRLQDVRGANDRNLGLTQTLRQIIREEGVLSLWSGLQVNTVRIIPATITTFLSYEYLSRYIEKILK